MKRKNSFFLEIFQLFFLIAICYCQIGGILSIQNTSINNSLENINDGCKTFTNGICQECQPGYLLNKDRKCFKVTENCKIINLETGVCQLCTEGFQIIGGRCIINQTVQLSDPGCKAYTGSKCQQCSYKWFMDSGGKCQKIDDNCRTWDNSGSCLSCYDGNTLNQGKCVISTSNSPEFNKLCKRFNGPICMECSYRSYFENNGICKQVDRNCNAFNQTNGICFSCYNGFILENGTCIYSSNSLMIDPLCQNYDFSIEKCVQCSYRSYQNQQGICTEVNPLCETFNQGICLTCYSGYTLINGQCMIGKEEYSLFPIELGCSQWSWLQNKCLRCQYRYYLNSKRTCVKVPDTCKTYDTITGKCLSCQQGYSFNNGVCQNQIELQPQNQQTLGCSVFDLKTNKCQLCQENYYLTSINICVKMPIYCQVCHSDGKCAKCLDGYFLQKGLCIKYKILGCKNLSESYCTQCQKDYLLLDGRCISLNELRKILNLNTQSPV